MIRVRYITVQYIYLLTVLYQVLYTNKQYFLLHLKLFFSGRASLFSFSFSFSFFYFLFLSLLFFSLLFLMFTFSLSFSWNKGESIPSRTNFPEKQYCTIRLYCTVRLVTIIFIIGVLKLPSPLSPSPLSFSFSLPTIIFPLFSYPLLVCFFILFCP